MEVEYTKNEKIYIHLGLRTVSTSMLAIRKVNKEVDGPLLKFNLRFSNLNKNFINNKFKVKGIERN